MPASKSLGNQSFRRFAIATTCWLTLATNAVLAQKPVATPDSVDATPASQAKTGETSRSSDTAGGAKSDESAGSTSSKSSTSLNSESTVKDSSAQGASSSAGVATTPGKSAGTEASAKPSSQNEGNDNKVTATELSVTPLDTAAGEDRSDNYYVDDKKRVKLLQQHEAVQHFHASQSYAKDWDYELAELEIRAAIMYMPEMKIAHRDYCLIALMRCKPLRSLAEFFMVVGLADPIPLTEDQQKELRIEASQAHYKKGLDKATEGKWDSAITELLWARTYLPNDPAIHRSLGFAYASKGDFKMAEQYYRSSIDIEPGNAFARADFAFLLAKKGKKDQAVAEMAEAVKADPDSTALHVDMGWLAEAQGDIATAEKEFRAAVRKSPQYTALWMHLGQILEKQKKIGDAREAYEKALEAERSNADAKAALARLNKTASAANVTKTPAIPVDGEVTAFDKDAAREKPAKDTPAEMTKDDSSTASAEPGAKPDVTPLKP